MLPQDPVMLLSYINTQLRDHYPSLDDFCKETGADAGEITTKLKAIDYEYDAALNKFI